MKEGQDRPSLVFIGMQMYETRFQPAWPCSFAPLGASWLPKAVHTGRGEPAMEQTNSKAEEKGAPAVPENDAALSVDELDKIAGGTISDPCEGGQFHSR
jgi:hypothetical protein